MRFKNFFLWSIIVSFYGLAFAACGDDDDNDELSDIEKEQALIGTWVCTDADVLNIETSGVNLSPAVIDLIEDQVEASLEGKTVVMDESNTTISGNVISFSDSDIKWNVKKLRNDYLEVVYDTNYEYQGYALKIKIEAEFSKIKQK